jgi:hypothetical protein
MMFIVRSVFWLSLVFSRMPFDSDAALRAVDSTQGAVVAGAVAAARAKCVTDMASCRAIVAAASNIVLATNGERPPAPRGAGKGRAAPAADTLSAADLAAPWRGRPTKSGA